MSWGARVRAWLPGAAASAGWLLVFALVAALLQLLGRAPWDADSAYHVAVGRLIAEHGVLQAFPWTPFSWLADHYADKELLLHLGLAPLAGLPWILASRIAATVLGTLVLFVLYRVLREEGVPRAGLWALLPLAASGAFVVRFAVMRPHLLAIALALVVTWAAARGRRVALAVACVLYPWCYVAWHLPLVLLALVELSRLLSGGKVRWDLAAVAALALAAGVAVHPNAGHLLQLWKLVHVDILLATAWGGRTGFELGREFEPFGPVDALRYVLVPGAMAVAAAWLAWRARREDPLPLAFALVALAFGVLTLRTQRFIEYLAPFAAAALALAVARQATRASVGAPPRALAAGVLAAAFVFTALVGARPVLAMGTRQDDVPPPFAAALRATIPPGEQVFTCEWGLTGSLMVALPERKFIVALDPVLFQAKDPDLYRTWYELPRRGPPDAARQVRERFGARWVMCMASPSFAPLFRSLRADPQVRPLLESPVWMVYDLGPPGL